MAHFTTSDGRPAWRALVLTLFPEMFPGPLDISLLGQARAANIWSLETLQIRDFGLGRHRQVDDTPAGGGAGMVLRADVLGPALDHAQTLSPDAPLIYLSPRGTPLTQSLARDLSEGPGVTLLAGRFEGIDQRVIDEKSLKEVSIGDYVLAGGELAAMVLIEACVRLLPGVLGAAESLASESFETGLLEYPQYTKPRDWEGRSIPEILLSGDHKKVAEWRRRQAEQLTASRRPDLLRPTRTPK
ncbi:tRNA (guanosine(37)-N1)-methyltransferase TrmD [Hyphomicrobium sp. 2TAF46]|uniref:tRNA (guanosine(37)-N1)-methyltransferase TrmD n=1 Tax=Hyphomicrobium sp. 2TAF46 TaxID=3233019 RepID=UPI003F8DBEE6